MLIFLLAVEEGSILARGHPQGWPHGPFTTWQLTSSKPIGHSCSQLGLLLLVLPWVTHAAIAPAPASRGSSEIARSKVTSLACLAISAGSWLGPLSFQQPVSDLFTKRSQANRRVRVTG